jgi:hypothetical protein
MGKRRAQVLSLAILTLAASPAAADTEAAKVTAAAIRAQGHACAEPVTAQRDAAASKPDEPVWLVKCGDGNYRVRLMGAARPHVERLP